MALRTIDWVKEQISSGTIKVVNDTTITKGSYVGMQVDGQYKIGQVKSVTDTGDRIIVNWFIPTKGKGWIPDTQDFVGVSSSFDIIEGLPDLSE